MTQAIQVTEVAAITPEWESAMQSKTSQEQKEFKGIVPIFLLIEEYVYISALAQTANAALKLTSS